MGKYQLIPHPDFPPVAVRALEVELHFSQPGVATLRYTVFSPPNALALPQEGPERRADDLWMTTCFEMFVRESTSTVYREFNFSPSTEWAAYRFDEYRSGRANAELAQAPLISSSRDGRFELHVTIPLDPSGGGQAIQLSAIIEEGDGTKSYWALAHPPGDPDFHHPDCFVLQLPPAV